MGASRGGGMCRCTLPGCSCCGLKTGETMLTSVAIVGLGLYLSLLGESIRSILQDPGGLCNYDYALGWELGQVEGVISAVVRCDDTAAKKTCRRFGVTRSSHAPRVVLLADRGLYEPDGPAHALASRDALVSWATEGYRATKRREVPPEPSAFEEALAWFWSALGLSRDGGGGDDDEL